jgi:predicted XRE-type DNA-binding protein
MSKIADMKKQPTRSASSKGAEITEGSDNPFADLGFANPELELAKSKLVMEIGRVIEERDLSQARAGQIIGLPQPKLSQLANGHWKSYSVDRLTRYPNKLGVTVRVSLERNRNTWKEGHFIVAGRR